AGKQVAVLGAGASAMDNAVAALAADALEVSVFCRRSELQRVQPFKWLSFPGFLRHFSELDDEWRWKFMEHLLGLREAFPKETWERVNEYSNFRLETGSPWQGLSIIDGKVCIETPKGKFLADFLIFGTGFVIDISRRSELRDYVDLIALWKDRYACPKDESGSMLSNYPYLGNGFEFLEKNIGTASWLRNIHLFTFGTTMSFGPSGASINAMKFAVPKLVNAITKDLFFDDIDTHYKSLKAYDLPEFAMLGDSVKVAPNAAQVRRLEDDSFD
ncbi:NAD(P)/FAD-dependent oxidoreductase, partial [Alphaproteobacteria bacterium]|nr:NAD(P)/FAD-dependent oxidoreductase [Alphaproteobacteria bacterium]